MYKSDNNSRISQPGTIKKRTLPNVRQKMAEHRSGNPGQCCRSDVPTPATGGKGRGVDTSFDRGRPIYNYLPLFASLSVPKFSFCSLR